MVVVRASFRRRCSACTLALLLVAAPSRGHGSTALAGLPRPPVTSSFFGVHQSWLGVAEPRGWPKAPVGSIRLWDNGVTWRDIETAPGIFDFRRLDVLMAQTRLHGASVLLVLGQSPAFHATNPTAPGFFGPGATSMPHRAAWLRYVRAVAARQRDVWHGRVAFQVWNEGNNPQYWTGTPTQLAQLTRWTSQVVSEIDPNIRVVSPAMCTRLASQLDTLRSYVEQRPGGQPLTAYLDAVGLSLYPPQDGGPEQAVRQLRAARRIMADAGVMLPVIDTEINYGLVGGPDNGGPGSYGPGSAPPPAPLPEQLQAAYVLRTYLLQASADVLRVYWYAWDRIDLMNTRMVEDDYITPTAAGRAFAVVRTWIVGTRPVGCARSTDGTRNCRFVAAEGVRTAVWNPTRLVPVVAGAGTTGYATSDGVTSSASEGDVRTVGATPILVLSRG
jgi:polysaccharide biosynthesis protein PslG